MKTVLLVIEGPESKYEYLKRIINCPYRVILIRNKPTVTESTNWHRKYIPDDDVIHISCRNPSRAISEIKQHLYVRNISPHGVLTYRDTAVPLTQYLAQALSLPPICISDPRNTRHKGAMRACLRAAGLPQPDFRICDSRDQAVIAARELGPPVIIKPSEMVSSLGVQKLTTISDEAVYAAFDNAVEADFPTENLRYEFNLSTQVIVEQYVPTPQEVSVEGLVIAGIPTILGITKKRIRALPEMEFAEVGHVHPFHLADRRQSELQELVVRALIALGLANCAFHAELLLRSDLPPIVTEVGARLAGDFIPMLLELATGVNFIEATVAASTGEDIINTVASTDRYAAIDFISVTERPTKLDAIFSEIAKEPDVVEAVEYPGASHGRIGHIVYLGDSLEAIDHRSKHYQSLL